MYYSAVPPNGTPSGMSQEKQPNIYVPAPSPYAPAPAGYAQAQHGLPPGLAAAPRFATGPQAYAVVSTPGHPGFGATMTPAYTSLPYPGLATIPTSSHAYISTGQYPGMSYQAAMAQAQRGAPPSHFSAPVQAGAPLIAAGYTPVPGAGIPQQAARGYPYGSVAAFPAAYSVPTGTAAAPGPYHTPSPYVPPF